MALTISIFPTSGRIGDIVTITATSTAPDEFVVPFNQNVVTFNGTDFDIIAKIVSGSTTELKVVVPPEAISGDVTVETPPQVGSTSIIDGQRATVPFSVVYENELFEQDTEVFNKGRINNKIKTVGSTQFNVAAYNKDMSYSNFVEVIDENSILQNIYTIVLTQKGERVFSEFGVSLDELLFSTYVNEESIKNQILTEVFNAIETYETRVTILKEQSTILVDDSNIILLLVIQMPRGNVEELGITLKSFNNTTAP